MDWFFTTKYLDMLNMGSISVKTSISESAFYETIPGLLQLQDRPGDSHYQIDTPYVPCRKLF